MGSKLTGDWGKLRNKLTNQMPRDLENLDTLAKQEAERLRGCLQEYILSQQGSWNPLDSETIDNKDSSQILVDTGNLADSFTVKDLGGDTYAIVPEGENDHASNMEVALYQEYGTEDIPPRPFVRPVYEQEGEATYRSFAKEVEVIVKK